MIYREGVHAPSWHFRTFAPGEAWARHSRRARHVACSPFERCRPFGERAPRANRSGAIKLPLKAAALARQRGAPAPHARRHERGALVGPCVPSDARSAERGDERRGRPSDARSAERGGAFLAPRCRPWLRLCAAGFLPYAATAGPAAFEAPERRAERGARCAEEAPERRAERGARCAAGFRVQLLLARLRLRRPSHARSAERGARWRRPSDARSAEDAPERRAERGAR